MECYKGFEVVDLNPVTFKIILHSLFIHLLVSYNFPKTFEWSDLMKKALEKGSDINETMKDIMESKQDFQVTQLSLLSFQQWCVRFHDSYSKVINYIYNANLSLMLSDNFSGVLNTLANVPNADDKVQVYWILMNKKQKKMEFKKSMQEIFTDDGDLTFSYNLLNEKSTITISIKKSTKC